MAQSEIGKPKNEEEYLETLQKLLEQWGQFFEGQFDSQQLLSFAKIIWEKIGTFDSIDDLFNWLDKQIDKKEYLARGIPINRKISFGYAMLRLACGIELTNEKVESNWTSYRKRESN